MSNNRGMTKQQIMVFVVHPYRGILLRKKKKMKELLIRATTCMNFKDTLNEGSQPQKEIHGMIPFR